MSSVKVENFESVLNALVEQVSPEDIAYADKSEARIVMGKIEVTGQRILLLVKKVGSYNEVKEIRKQIFESRSEFGLDVIKYAILYQNSSYVYFIYDDPYEPKPKLIRRDLTSNLGSFKKKFSKFIKDFRNPSAWAELFDRTDLIEDFYKLYLKVWKQIQKTLEKQVTSENERKIIADNLLIQLMIIWYLQEKRFLNEDPKYLVNMFKKYKDMGYSSYFEFLKDLFKEMMSEPNDEKGIYRISEKFGKIVVTGPAPFLNGKDYFENVEIPDELFYKDDATEYLKKTEPKKIKDGDERLTILNFFESRDWTEGNIDEYVLGALFEKLMTSEERKEKGAYYTPDEITNYICNNTIRPYLVGKVNEELDTKFELSDDLFEKVFEMDKDKALKVLKTLYKYLQDIKILDPAVGSGHFLESTIDVLVNIYLKLIKAIKDLKIGEEKDENGKFIFSIRYADKDGSIKDILLISLSDEELELRLKFHIIISSNIYGVDIMPNAIKIARARMFLTLAKHFIPDKVHVRFPNIHFNLRVGNSLIGFVDLDAFERFDGNKSLSDFFDIYGDNEGETEKIRKFELNLDEDLKGYIGSMDGILNTQALKLYQDVRDLYHLSISKELIIKVLKLRNDLIKILLVSLNSDYAVKLKDFIDGLTEVFNKRLNEEFIKYLEGKGITLSEADLQRIGYFHWVMEFSEVFLRENKGFDVVVGNPPYLRIQSIKKIDPILVDIYNSIFETAFKNYDIAVLFFERGVQVMRNGGYFGFISTNRWIVSDYGEKLRGFISRQEYLYELTNFGNNQVFEGISTYTAITILRKASNESFRHRLIRELDRISDFVEIDFEMVPSDKINEKPWVLVKNKYIQVFEVLSNLRKLSDVTENIFVGLQTSADPVFILEVRGFEENCIRVYSKSQEKEYLLEKDLLKPILKGDEIKKWRISKCNHVVLFPYKIVSLNDARKAELIDIVTLQQKYPKIWNYLLENKEKLLKRADISKQPEWYRYIYPKNLSEFEQPKIMTQVLSKSASFTLDKFGIYYFVGGGNAGGYGITIKKDSGISLECLLTLLNSNLLDWYLKNISVQFRGGYYSYAKRFIEQLPIKIPENQTPFETLSDYLLFLCQESENTNAEEIKLLENLVNNLVYELYFKQKFIEDSKKAIEEGKEPIYQQLEKGPFLIDLVSKYLKPIDYDSYAKLAYSIEPLSEEEKQKIEKMKEEYLKTIKEVVEAIKADKEIMGLIERIKSHEWVRVIEGGN